MYNIIAATPLISFSGGIRQALNIIEDLAHLEKSAGELCPELEAFASALNEAYTHYQLNKDEKIAYEDAEIDAEIRNSILEDMGEAGVRQVPGGVSVNVEFDSEG